MTTAKCVPRQGGVFLSSGDATPLGRRAPAERTCVPAAPNLTCDLQTFSTSLSRTQHY